MNKPFILFLMIFMHVIADYNVQGCLANLKQKQWWISACKNSNKDFNKYKDDYIIALLMHAFSWAFMIMLPLFFTNGFNMNLVTTIILLANTVIHFYIDDLKANRDKINLVQDQSFHMIQILVTWLIWTNIM